MDRAQKLGLEKIRGESQQQIATLIERVTAASSIYPNVAKVGGLQSQGVKGAAVAIYRKSLTTQDLKSSGFPEG